MVQGRKDEEARFAHHPGKLAPGSLHQLFEIFPVRMVIQVGIQHKEGLGKHFERSNEIKKPKVGLSQT